MPTYRLVAYIETVTEIEAETEEHARLAAGLRDDYELIHEWDEAYVIDRRVYPE